MKIDIISENKTYKFCLCPLLDFCVFIDELLKIKKKKHPLQERKIYADLIRYTRTITQHIQSVHAKICARQTRMERCRTSTFCLNRNLFDFFRMEAKRENRA